MCNHGCIRMDTHAYLSSVNYDAWCHPRGSAHVKARPPVSWPHALVSSSVGHSRRSLGEPACIHVYMGSCMHGMHEGQGDVTKLPRGPCIYLPLSTQTRRGGPFRAQEHHTMRVCWPWAWAHTCEAQARIQEEAASLTTRWCCVEE